MKNHIKFASNGFTFVELLVVITIIGVIFSSGAVAYSAITVRSREARRQADIESIRQALEMCRSLTGSYPLSIANEVNCSGNVMLESTPKDPKCNTVYVYSRSDATNYTLSANCEGSTYSVKNP